MPRDPPYFGTNENDIQWVIDLDWEFSREFTLTKGFLDQANIALNIESLDTVTEISINGKRIAKTKNMFLRFRKDVKQYLKVGKNTISVLIKSPQAEAIKEAKKWPFPVPSTTNHPFKNINALRKVQCHPGWDWGIAMAVSGIYGDVTLIGYDTARIEHVYTNQTHSKNACDVKVTTELYTPKAGTQALTVKFAGETKTINAKLDKGINKVSTSFTVKNPKLWWPPVTVTNHSMT